MITIKKILRLLPLLLSFAFVACDSDEFREEPIPEGYGRLRMTIAVPEAAATRTVTGTWLAGEGRELIHEYWVLVVDASNNIADVIHKTVTTNTHDDTEKWHSTPAADETALLTPGEYKLYAIANFTAGMLHDAGLRADDAGKEVTVTTLPADFDKKAIRIPNGYGMGTDEYIPMSYNTDPTAVTVTAGSTTDAGTLVVWRMMAKLELDFVNEGGQKIDILGMEIEPLNDGTVGTTLKQTVDLKSTTANNAGDLTFPAGVKNDKWPYEKGSSVSLANIPAKSGSTNGTRTFVVYVNESDASFTSDANQYSLRFKVKRNDTFEEQRFGITTNETEGFKVIRRNDWIKIPIHFTDWQFRIEVLSFPPIAGFAAHTVSADALETTFNTGGYICLKPMFRNNLDDPEGVWYGLDDPRITFVMPTGGNPYGPYALTDKRVQAIDGTSDTGIIMKGELGIFNWRDKYDHSKGRMYFHRLGGTEQIVAELLNDDTVGGLVTVTLRVKLGAFYYEFSHNVIKAKKT